MYIIFFFVPDFIIHILLIYVPNDKLLQVASLAEEK